MIALERQSIRTFLSSKLVTSHNRELVKDSRPPPGGHPLFSHPRKVTRSRLDKANLQTSSSQIKESAPFLCLAEDCHDFGSTNLVLADLAHRFHSRGLFTSKLSCSSDRPSAPVSCIAGRELEEVFGSVDNMYSQMSSRSSITLPSDILSRTHIKLI
jgi:hypothetical protein